MQIRLERIFVNLSAGQLRSLLTAVAGHVGSFGPGVVDCFCTTLAASDPADRIAEHIVTIDGEAMPFIMDAWESEGGITEFVFLVPRRLGDLIQAECASLGADVRRMWP